jgi:hypothetical protein
VRDRDRWSRRKHQTQADAVRGVSWDTWTVTRLGGDGHW